MFSVVADESSCKNMSRPEQIVSTSYICIAYTQLCCVSTHFNLNKF